MFKSKKSQYFLVPIVIILWSLIAYQFMEFGKDDDIIAPIEIKQQAHLPSKVNERNISLNLNYPDPFLKVQQIVPVIEEIIEKPIELKETENTLPEIIYKGYITNDKTGDKVALFEYENNPILLELNGLIGQYQLAEILKDSALFVRKAESFYISVQ